MRQMINSMSTKMEIGSPMASMYILGNPDHYCSHKYVNFPWRSYVTFVKVDDYRFRPLAYENVNLYEWVQCSDKKARTRKERQEFEEQLEINNELIGMQTDNPERIDNEDPDFERDIEPKYDDSDFADFIAAFKTHAVHCDFQKLDKIIPNFMGGAIPRADKGDREYYCMTILTLFKPWRTPADLNDNDSKWDQIFHKHVFTSRQQELIRNFNIRYECNDARNDHYAIMRKKMSE
ncbi:hypothetical protein B0H10DRAFT_1786022 [Mycena sp. CBHHK59/15]|nr:hypothetical protein B0H10DRAFT_1786022 [Mycena sp. CBHHK59/15]